ncbi:hypothetical protein EVB39_110 [Rhizobium phage RHph_TM3_3_9]|nr:hypothetical protein EVB39_110 [Rhizobium phage RHph_TM3_3_9]QIG68631.1 hypothetical protein EVB66_110 [Rhizobium phage RHph_TM3_3_13]QIG74489.1 hypothetical protein EVC09_109 [Rhizobium phage RHph_TM3_3_10]QXV74603.1 hypothetical protein [Rhizobium phage RHEph19]
MTAYAEYHGQILREVTGIHIDGKTYRAAAIKADHEGLRAVLAAVLEIHGVAGTHQILKTALADATMPTLDMLRAMLTPTPAEPAPCPPAGANPPVTYCPMQKIEELKRAAAPLVAIADAYDANDLDDEARKFWGPNGIQHVNTTPPEKIELYTGRGGKQLLTLAHCFRARDAAR